MHPQGVVQIGIARACRILAGEDYEIEVGACPSGARQAKGFTNDALDSVTVDGSGCSLAGNSQSQAAARVAGFRGWRARRNRGEKSVADARAGLEHPTKLAGFQQPLPSREREQCLGHGVALGPVPFGELTLLAAAIPKNEGCCFRVRLMAPATLGDESMRFPVSIGCGRDQPERRAIGARIRLPLARRALRTLRPFLVAHRARKPWVRARFRRLGLKVCFMLAISARLRQFYG